MLYNVPVGRMVLADTTVWFGYLKERTRATFPDRKKRLLKGFEIRSGTRLISREVIASRSVYEDCMARPNLPVQSVLGMYWAHRTVYFT